MTLVSEILQWILIILLVLEHANLYRYWRKHGTDRYRRRYK